MALIRQYTVTVGASSVELLPEIQSRQILDLYLRNTSTAGQVISLGIGTEAVSGSGIVMNANDVAAFSRSDNYEVPLSRYTAISSAVGGTVSVYVRLED